ncbi:MAG: hypothetical protein DHS20C20_10300 [Ardenticatenaceae bacterium]|nr:MAG: hypothetical protein DHS20C20_10300 [Ardenticatenaceae bacterium]
MKILWLPPEPRSGLAGTWDKFVGPGATDAEQWLQLLGGLSLTAVISLSAFTQRNNLNWSTLQWVIFLLFAFDLSGGILTNATATAKRWYHRPGQRFVDHFGFVAIHGIHLAAVAWLFRGGDWLYFAIYFGYLLLGTAVILRTPLYLKRPLGLLLYSGVLLLNSSLILPMPGLAWFIPFFFLKLLVAHLLPEAPFQPENE